MAGVAGCYCSRYSAGGQGQEEGGLLSTAGDVTRAEMVMESC